jgi:hypothetical protein
MELPARTRVLIAVTVAIIGFTIAFTQMSRSGSAHDFSWPYRAAERLTSGENPYTDPRNDLKARYPFNGLLYYPMPAVLLAVPFTVVSQPVGGASFLALGSGLLAFGITRKAEHWHRLILFLSGPFYVTAVNGQ